MDATKQQVFRGSSLGLLARSKLAAALLAMGLPIDVRLPREDALVTHTFADCRRQVSLPLTFTPFASVKPCSARCVFCSETLRHRASKRLSASLRPDTDYGDGLRQALAQLQGLPIGLSLSGLEATDDADWLCDVLAACDAFAAQGGEFTSKVLYTNANGITKATNGPRLLPRLARFGLSQVEVSRHACDQVANQSIMRFRPQQPIADSDVFADTLTQMLSVLPVRLVCVVQRGGVWDAASLRDYLAWAYELGIRDVVLREFSRLNDDYLPNRTYRHIEAARVPIESLLAEVLPVDGQGTSDFEPQSLVAGYYYWNLRCRWRDMRVTFETSDYGEMKRRHRSEVVYKLIYHANGTLNSDWDPDKAVLFRTGDRQQAG